MKKLLIFSILVLGYTLAYSQQKPAYILYSANGKKIKWGKMVKKLAKQDVIFFGETHNNAIAHWLELEVAKDLQPLRKLIMGAEMFEADNQESLDLYLQGKLSAKGLDSSARLWKNYPTDYAPLVNYAKDNSIPFVATNIPRRYASMVAKGGFEVLDSLPAAEKAWIAPLPMKYDAEQPGYKNMIEMMKGHGGPNLPKAQSSKDATMAYFTLKNFRPGSLFIHYNGSYHSENHDGIIWHLKQAQPELKILTITVVSQKELSQLLAENKNKADFIICVDEDMTNTY